MKFEIAKVEEIKQKKGLIGMYEAIEYAGKTCTNSTPKGGETAVKFTEAMINADPQHGRPLEFGTVYLKLPWWKIFTIMKYSINHFSRVRKWRYVTTNFRVIIENRWNADMKYLCEEPTENHALRKTLHWTISRVTADSFRTHCSLSSLMQSTRYCNYSKDRFGNEITCIFPQWAFWRYGYTSQEKTPENETELNVIIPSLMKKDEKFREYVDSLDNSEKKYIELLSAEEDDKGIKILPQYARGILPLDIKTEFIQCGFEDDWKHFFYLRVEKSAHPDAQYIAAQAQVILNLYNN